MKKYIRVKLPNSNCTGISLEVDSNNNIKEVTNVKDANKHINGSYKLHLRVKKMELILQRYFFLIAKKLVLKNLLIMFHQLEKN